jgi:hypothetical protein
MPTVTDIHGLLPLLAEAKTAKEFGAVLIAHAPAGRKMELALAARDALGRSWTESTVFKWLKPSSHTEKGVDAKREHNRSSARRAREADPSHARDAANNWRQKNVEKWKANRKRRYADDPAFALRQATNARIRCALLKAVGKPGKSRPTLGLLGCSAEEYRLFLESHFAPGMCWDNWTNDGWHIDHVVPVAAFDLTTHEGQRAAFHFTNTRPMWAAENLRKGSVHEGKRHTHLKQS